MNKAIARAIQLGEARQAAVQRQAISDIDESQKETLTLMSEQIEDMADNVFMTVQENRAKIADNYLSLKAYAVSAKDALEDYVTKGKGRNLASIGDLLTEIANHADVKIGKSYGVGAGATELPLVFSGKKITIKNPVNKINFLVNEFVSLLTDVQGRWQMGIGKYLLAKVEEHMMGKGVLEVDKVDGKSGNYVFINGHSVGLSSKLSDFEQLAVRMPVYQTALTKLTAKPAKHGNPSKPAKYFVKGKEWQGN